MLQVILQIFGAIFVVLLTAGYIFVKSKFNYWAKRNVPHTTPSFPLGNCQGISKTVSLGGVLHREYIKSKGLPYCGFYLTISPGLLLRDPELVKLVMTKDFHIFSDRGFKINQKIDPISGHLFFQKGAAWRNTRVKLTPAFTSGKLKNMFPIIEASSIEMCQFLKDNPSKIVETGSLFTKFTTNVITRCAFGIDVDFFKNPDLHFERMIDELGKPSKSSAFKRGLSFALGQIFGQLPIALVPKDISDFFINVIDETMKYRAEKNVKRNDFLQLLIELRTKGFIEDADAQKKDANELQGTKFTLEDAAAAAFGFLLGGFDTSSTILQCCSFELAINPKIREAARAEILQAMKKHEGKLSYDCLNDLKYLEQIINETLRLHPVTPFFTRVCNEDYLLPDGLVLEKGTQVWIPVTGLQSDPEHFPNPEVFDPDRFSSERKHEIKQGTFMPFGDGPRNCIGSRFAMIQMKAGLAALLHNFEIDKCSETPTPPLKLDPKKTLALVLGGVHVKITPR